MNKVAIDLDMFCLHVKSGIPSNEVLATLKWSNTQVI